MTDHPAAAPVGVDRCTSCGARVVPGQDWCSLCLQPLQAGAQRSAEAPHDPADPCAGAATPTAPTGPGQLPPGVAEAMLAELAATSAAGRPLGRGPLSGTGRGLRLALGCGAGVVLLGVVLALLALVGLLL